jgi:hypothetical protein
MSPEGGFKGAAVLRRRSPVGASPLPSIGAAGRPLPAKIVVGEPATLIVAAQIDGFVRRIFF